MTASATGSNQAEAASDAGRFGRDCHPERVEGSFGFDQSGQ